MDSILVSCKGIVSTVRVREVIGWNPAFDKSEVEEEDDDSSTSTIPSIGGAEYGEKEDVMGSAGEEGGGPAVKDVETEEPPMFPPGFEPKEVESDHGSCSVNVEVKEKATDVQNRMKSCGGENFTRKEGSRISPPNSHKSSGFSIVDELAKTIGVGRAVGFSMQGTEADLQKMIAHIGGTNGGQ